MIVKINFEVLIKMTLNLLNFDNNYKNNFKA